ncbi:MAG: type II toxin-antitoxin system mRNA interferase toxin, RelE/StbE family [Bdellovibrionota bacterium]
MVSVRWSNNALANLDTLDFVIRGRILGKVSWLRKNFSEIVPEELHREFKGLYKLRVGDYRVVYSIRKDIITIEAVGHRRDVYR